MSLRSSNYFRGLTGHSGYSGYSGVSASGSTLINVYQPSHGFNILDVLKSSGVNGQYSLAQANSTANADAIGIVYDVIDPDNFVLISYGEVINANIPNETPGTVLYLSATTPGQLTITEPYEYNQVSKPMAIITTSGQKMMVINWRGVLIVDNDITRNATWVIQNPEVANIPGPRLNADFTCIRLDGYISGTGNLTFNIEKRDTINVSGIDILLTDMTIDSTGSYTVTFENDELNYGEWLNLDISAVNGTCDFCTVCLTLLEE